MDERGKLAHPEPIMGSVLKAIIFGLFAWLAIQGQASASVAILADGADGNSARIAIRYAITKGDLAAFESAIDRVSRTATNRIAGVPFVTVELNSPGGDVVEALGIGRAIYAHSAFTRVRQGQECVSACVFIFAAGAVRTPQPSAAIGVHKPLLVSWRNMDYRQARAKYDGLMQYLRLYFLDLGVSEAAYDAMMQTDSADMRYFSPAELQNLRLGGESPGWRKHYAALNAAAAVTDTVATAGFADAPRLPAIDQSYRDVVFMPGDFPPEQYYAGIHFTFTHFVWDSLDEGRQAVGARTPDAAEFIAGVYRKLWPVAGPYWWLLALILFELARGRSTPWPDGRYLSSADKDRWRLAPFRPYGEGQAGFNSGN